MTTREWTLQLNADLRKVGDPVADQVVHTFFDDLAEQEPGRLFSSLVANTNLPDEDRDTAVDEYYRAEVTNPPWYEPAAVAAGQEFFERRGLHFLSALYGASLPTAYAGWRGVHVLQLTARLRTDAKRRLTETAQFMVDVTTADGLQPGGIGIRTTRRVRLMHAAVRWLVLHDPRVVQGPADDDVPHYDPAWGVPVCQADLLNTLLTFTQVPFDVLEHSGVEVSEEERAAYLHVFNVVGYHLGIRSDLLPLDIEDIRLLTSQMPTVQFGRSGAGREMTAALLEVSRQMMPGPLKRLPDSMVRFQVGDPLADILGVPAADWTRHLFAPMSAVSRAVSTLTSHGSLPALLGERMGRRILNDAVRTDRGGNRPPFDLPTHLADRWKVTKGR